MDEEVAEMLAGEEIPKPQQRFTEWTPEREALASIYDMLCHLISVTIAVSGQKPPELDHFPRPVSAVERARKALKQKSYFAAMQWLFPDEDK